MSKIGNFTKQTLKNGAKVIGGHRVKFVSEDKEFIILLTSYGYYYGIFLEYEKDGAHIDEDRTPKQSKEHCFNSLEDCKKFWKVGEFAEQEDTSSEEAKPETKEEEQSAEKTRMQTVFGIKDKKDPEEKPAEKKTNEAKVLKAYKNGMFYEFFDEDAVKAGRALGIPVIESGSEKSVGFPVNEQQGYLVKLVKAGYQVKVYENDIKKPRAEKTAAAKPKSEPKAKKAEVEVEVRKLEVAEPIQSRSMELMREKFLKVCEEQGIEIDKTCIKQSKEDPSNGTLVGYKEKKAVVEIAWNRKEEGKEKKYIFG